MHSIDHFLNTQISTKKKLIDQLNAAVLPLLPANCRQHITASNFSNNELTLIADSPVWAARLRTQHKQIISTISEQLKLPIKSIKVRFQQPQVQQKKPAKAAPVLSQQSSEIIKNTADSISDEALKESLLRLAKNVT